MEHGKSRVAGKDEEVPRSEMNQSEPDQTEVQQTEVEQSKVVQPSALAPIRFSEQQSAAIDRAWGEIKNVPEMQIRDQTFTTEEVHKMGRAAINYVGGMMDFLEAAGRITGMYKPEQVMTKKVRCPHCGLKNPEHARFCMECGGELYMTAEFKVVRASAEVIPDGAPQAPKDLER